MAVDTKKKRAVAGVHLTRTQIVPDGSVDSDDREASSWVYIGFPFPPPAPPGDEMDGRIVRRYTSRAYSRVEPRF